MLKRIKTYLIIAAFIVPPFFIGASAYADSLGDKVIFNTNTGYDSTGRSTVPATLRTISDHAYFYVDDKFWSTLSSTEAVKFNNDLKNLATEFDTITYPKETAFWGSEPKPGIDGDPRITIFLEDLTQGTGGYFESNNLYSKASDATSNQREMIAANAQANGSVFLKVFLAHEFQHMISQNQKEFINDSTEDIWLNESRSEYSITLDGYNDIYYGSSLEHRVRDFMENPYDSLTEWPNIKADYATAVIFSEYLIDRFGPGILNETLHYKSYGIPSLNEYLRVRGTDFEQVYLDWMAALYLNDRSIDPKYGYSKGGLNTIKVNPQVLVSMNSNASSYTNSISVKDWQPYWIEYNLRNITDRTKSLRFDVNGQSGENFLVSYITFYDNGQIVVGRIPVSSGKATAFGTNSSTLLIRKVVLAVTDGQKVIDFGKNGPIKNVSINASIVGNSEVQEQTLKDGSLIKRPREKEIYVIRGKYKRYLNQEVIRLYGQLDPSKAIEVAPEVFDSYQTSNYVRYVNDKKVYAVWPDGTIHWLHITPQHWDASYRDWNSIFIISDSELRSYKAGAEINH